MHGPLNVKLKKNPSILFTMTRDARHISYFPLVPSTIYVPDPWVIVPGEITGNDHVNLFAAKN